MRAFLNRLGRRLALEEAFGWPTFWIAAFVYFGTTVLFDARRFGGPFWFWLTCWGFGQGILFVWVFATKKLFLDRVKTKTKRVVLTLIIGTTAGIARGFFIGLASSATELATSPQWGFRIGGGAVAGFVLTVAGSALIGAAVEHAKVVDQLQLAQASLLEARKSTSQTIDDARNDIAALASDTLLPRLSAIEKALANTKEISQLAKEIRAVVAQEVRPTTSLLVKRVERSLSEVPDAPARKTARLGLPSRFQLGGALSPTITFGIALMLCVSTFVPLTDPTTTALSIVGAVILWGILDLTARALSRLPRIGLVPGTFVLGLIGALSTVPLSLLTQWSLPKYLHLTAMPINSAFIMAVLAVGIGFTKIVDTERANFEVQLQEFNDELARELKWIDGQLWVIRREWAYLLHGRVQSALTAAITRIGQGEKLDAKTLKLVIADVERAKTAIYNGINQPFELESSLNEIAESWAGLCELELDFSAQALQSAKEDLGIGRSLNEIIREVVSNAVRHGNATKVTVSLSEGKGELRLVASNNGKPVTKKSRASLGTEMLDEVTLDWSLKNLESPRRVVLEARLAKATSSF